MFLAFFIQFLCDIPQRNWIFSNIVCCTESLWQRFFLFVALSHCDKWIFCSSHWVTASNKTGICCKKKPKCVEKEEKYKKGIKVPKRHKEWQKGSRKYQQMMHSWPFLAYLWEHLQILFVTVTKCHKQKICLSQWLSATNKTNLCHSDSVQQTILTKISNFFVASDKWIWKKSQKGTSIHIWISPQLSNCFGVPYNNRLNKWKFVAYDTSWLAMAPAELGNRQERKQFIQSKKFLLHLWWKADYTTTTRYSAVLQHKSSSWQHSVLTWPF